VPERQSSRKDAIRNREAVLAAADALFSRRESPEDVTMADVAAAAGVGKGTLFRAFGDRAGLLRALYEARLEPIRQAVATGPPPLGPATPPHVRVPALLDAALSPEDQARVRAVLDRYRAEGPVDFHDLRTRESGRQRFVYLHLLVPDEWTVKRGHDLAERVAIDIGEVLPGAKSFVHVEPIHDPASYDHPYLGEPDAPPVDPPT